MVRGVDYTVRRSKRAKHILVHVDADGKVELVVPWNVSLKQGEEFLREREEWIENMRKKQLARQQNQKQVTKGEAAKLKKQAREYLERQADAMADRLGVHIEQFSVGDYKSQWGSCNKKTRRLAFSWRLMLAPEAVRRYVVAHEVAHLRQANHSAKFWDLVERLEPEYKSARAWLRRHGRSLH